MTRDELMAALKSAGVDTRTFFIPVHEQPVFAEGQGLPRASRFPVSAELAEKGFYLPSGLALTPAQIAAVCAAVEAVRPEAAGLRIPWKRPNTGSTSSSKSGHWWFRGRRAAAFRLLRAPRSRSAGPDRILDAGCGTGLNL